MAKSKFSTIVKIGVVGVDSGQLIMCDPCYIESQWKTPPESGNDHAHDIYRHEDDGKLWQFTYGAKPSNENVNKFPGSYADIIPEYGKSPNQLIDEGKFKKTGIDPTPHIPRHEFSYRGCCKETIASMHGQLNYTLGHPGAGVVFNTGAGDGTYDVYAEIKDVPGWGKRVTKVWIDFFKQ